MSAAASSAGRPVVALIGPLPPPTHGLMVVMQRILQSRVLQSGFRVVHVDLSDRRDLRNVGRFDLENIRLAIVHWMRLVRVLFRDRPDLVHLPLAQNTLGAMRDWVLLATSLLFPGARVVGHVAGGGFADYVRDAPRPLRWMLTSSVSRCATLITSTEWHRRRIQDLFPDTKCVVVVRGTEELPDELTTTDAENLRPTERPLTVMYASSFLTSDKGFFTALEAARGCLDAGLRCHWRFVGSFVADSDRERAQALRGGLGAIEFSDPVPREHLLELYREADVFVFPTIGREGFGLVRVEAMAAGLPVITTEAGGAREFIRDGIEGFVVDYGSAEQIVRRLTELAANEAQRLRMGAAARAMQRERFGLDAFERTLAAAWQASLRSAEADRSTRSPLPAGEPAR